MAFDDCLIKQRVEGWVGETVYDTYIQAAQVFWGLELYRAFLRKTRTSVVVTIGSVHE